MLREVERKWDGIGVMKREKEVEEEEDTSQIHC